MFIFYLIFYFTGRSLNEDQLLEVAELSGVLTLPEDFLSTSFREQCEEYLPDEISVDECAMAFKFLKQNML